MPWGDNNKGPWGGNTPEPPKKNSGGKKPVNEIDELVQKSKEQLQGLFGGGGNSSGGDGAGLPDRKFIMLGLLAVFVLWLSTGFYEIDAKEQGVILRFGEFHRTSEPGLGYRAPSPFEKIIKVPVKVVNRVEIGLRSVGGRNSGVREVPEESSMITGDENIVDVPFEIQWVISDARKFLFNVREPEETVKAAAESVMREVIGRTDIKGAISGGKYKIREEALTLLQSILDEYETGITIDALELGKVRYPSAVRGAFTDVQNAKTEAESAINQAEAYKNDIIPRARGEAEKVIQQSEAFKNEVVARAEGEASRFLAVYDKYKVAKSITRKRIYLETMEDVLKGTDKILLDMKDGSGVLPYLPLNEMRKR